MSFWFLKLSIGFALCLFIINYIHSVNSHLHPLTPFYLSGDRCFWKTIEGVDQDFLVFHLKNIKRRDGHIGGGFKPSAHYDVFPEIYFFAKVANSNKCIETYSCYTFRISESRINWFYVIGISRNLKIYTSRWWWIVFKNVT